MMFRGVPVGAFPATGAAVVAAAAGAAVVAAGAAAVAAVGVVFELPQAATVSAMTASPAKLTRRNRRCDDALLDVLKVIPHCLRCGSGLGPLHLLFHIQNGRRAKVAPHGAPPPFCRLESTLCR